MILSVNVRIDNIDYEKTFQQIFPILRKKFNEVESKNMIIRLFQKLDDAALPLLLSIMNCLSESTKNELLVLCLNTYSEKLLNKLNEELEEHPFGQYMHIGNVSIVQKRDTLYLWIGQIQVDCKELVKAKISGKIGSLIYTNKKLTELTLEFLQKDLSKQMLLKIAKTGLDKYGLIMELTDIQIRQDILKPDDIVEVEKHLKLTDETEIDILNALAEYLREKTADI